MGETVDQVADALRAAGGLHRPDDAETLARVAITALRKVNVELICAGADVPDSVGRFWPKMIDFILRCPPA